MKTILIADDDFKTRRLLSITFGRDYHVLEAADGVRALKMTLEHRPDVVILDDKMPRLDGLAVLHAIKSDPELATILVAMLTGRGQFSDLARGMDLGADAYFIKPFSQKSLHTWVGKNLKLREDQLAEH